MQHTSDASDTLEGLPLIPLDPARPSGAQIAASLRDAILDMRLTPGHRLSEAEIGRHCGASRTPVREALAQLRDAGLVHTWPNRGTVVTKLSKSQVEAAQFLREAVECALVARLCAAPLAGATRAALEATLQAQADAVAHQDRAAFHGLDDAFHRHLADALAQDRVTDVLAREKMVLDRLRVLSLGDGDHMAQLYTDHRAVFEAICAGDGAAAERAMRTHLRRVLGTLSALIARHRDYFDEAEPA